MVLVRRRDAFEEDGYTHAAKKSRLGRWRSAARLHRRGPDRRPAGTDALRVADQWLTAVITADEVRALKLGGGDDAIAIVRPTQVMIARSATTDAHVIPSRMTRRRQRRQSAFLRATPTGPPRQSVPMITLSDFTMA